MARKILTFFVVLSGVLTASTAFAHAVPLLYEPSHGSLVEILPETVSITFSERAEPEATHLVVFDPDGNEIQDSETSVDDSNPRRVFIELPTLEKTGTYTVSWKTVSADDGHFSSGAFAFSVGSATAPITPVELSVRHGMKNVEGFGIFLELLGQALLVGTCLVLLIRRRLIQSIALDEVTLFKINGRLKKTVAIGILLVLVGIATAIIGSSSIFEGTFTERITALLETTSGESTLYRSALAIIFCILFWIRNRSSKKKAWLTETLLWTTVILIAFLRAKVSHAAASTFHPGFSVLVNLLHLFAKDLWIGGLIAFLITFNPFSKTGGKHISLFLSTIFSRYAAIAFGIGGITGAYIVWLHLKDPFFIIRTEWGSLFIMLSVLGIGLLASRLGTTLSEEKKSEHGKPGTLGIFLPIEASIGAVILFITAFIIITTPPLGKAPEKFWTVGSRETTVTLSEHAFEKNMLLIEAKDPKASFEVLPTITATNEAAGIGPLVISPEIRFEGGYVFPKALLTPPGVWHIEVLLQKSEGYDATARFTLDTGRLNKKSERSTLLLFGSIAVAIGSLIGSVFLYQLAKRREKRITLSKQKESSSIPLAESGSWAFSLLASVFAINLLAGGHGIHVGNAFFKSACERNGHFFHENIPTREGAPTTEGSVFGCMVGWGAGTYHFADPREYFYFIRPARPSVTLTTSPKEITPGTPSTLTFTFRDEEGNPVPNIVPNHDRIIHTYVVSKDFTVLNHLHAEDAGPITESMKKESRFPITFTFPREGQYLIGLDATVRATPINEHFYINVGSPTAMPNPGTTEKRRATIEEYDVVVTTSSKKITSGKKTKLTFTVSKNGTPVTDLEPYLSSPGHIAVFASDLSSFAHLHPLPKQTFLQTLSGESQHAAHLSLSDGFGPTLEAEITFPKSGAYKLFLEFRHNRETFIAPFTLRVE